MDDILDEAKKRASSYKRDLEKIIKKEGELLANIQSMDALKNIQKFWEQNKIVIDALASQLSRINDGVQHVTIDVEHLKLPTRITDDLLLSLNSSGILDYFAERNSAVVTSEPVRNFLKGQNIIVKDAQRLSELQEKIAVLVESANKTAEVMAAAGEPIRGMIKPREAVMIPLLESESMRNFNNQAREDQRNRAMMKHDRILADKTPPKQHILKTILEHYEIDNKNDTGSISIDYYHFNFEESGFGQRKMEMYLDEVVKDGCISGYIWHPSHIRSRYVFNGVNKEMITKALGESNNFIVDISNDSFSPETLRIMLGDTVRFRNVGIVKHSATGHDLSWGTGTIEPSQFFDYQFRRVGNFSYFDSYNSKTAHGQILVDGSEGSNQKLQTIYADEDGGSPLQLLFDPRDGKASFDGHFATFNQGTKTRALLTLLHKNSGMPFGVKEFVEWGNKMISNERHYFKGVKDIDDTLMRIKKELSVSDGLPFTIVRKVSKENAVRWRWPKK